jgi:hypothetical protein
MHSFDILLLFILLCVVANVVCIFIVSGQLVLHASLPKFLHHFCGQKWCTQLFFLIDEGISRGIYTPIKTRLVKAGDDDDKNAYNYHEFKRNNNYYFAIFSQFLLLAFKVSSMLNLCFINNM